MPEQNIFEKIHKLIALSTSSNQNEAMTALAKAAELMQKYDITHAQIEEKELDATYGELTHVDRGETTSQSKYKYLLLIGVCNLYKVENFRVKVSMHRRKVFWVGRKHRIEIAIHLYEYLIDSIERLVPKGASRQTRQEFRIGAAINIRERIDELIVKNLEQTDRTDNPEATAIAPIDYRQEIQCYVDTRFNVDRGKKIKIGSGSQEGYRSASQIALNDKIQPAIKNILSLTSSI